MHNVNRREILVVNRIMENTMEQSPGPSMCATTSVRSSSRSTSLTPAGGLAASRRSSRATPRRTCGQTFSTFDISPSPVTPPQDGPLFPFHSSFLAVLAGSLLYYTLHNTSDINLLTLNSKLDKNLQWIFRIILKNTIKQKL
jgi:hypothetical protein